MASGSLERVSASRQSTSNMVKVAEVAENSVTCSLERLVSVTEKIGNLRKDLKELILQSVSRTAFIELDSKIGAQNEELAVLKKQFEEAKYHGEASCMRTSGSIFRQETEGIDTTNADQKIHVHCVQVTTS